MHRLPTGFSVPLVMVASLMLSGLWVGSAISASSGGEGADSRVAVAYPYRGISVFSAKGKRIRVWEPAVLHEGSVVRTIDYYAPDLHPGGRRVVGIRCTSRYADEAYRKNDLKRQNDVWELVELSVDEEREIVLLDLSTGGTALAPAYSPDGESVVLLQDGGVVVYSIENRKIVKTIPRVLASTYAWLTPAEAQFYSLRPSTASIRWAQDGSAVFALGPRPKGEPLPEGKNPPNGMVRVDLRSAEVSWLDLERGTLADVTGPFADVKPTVELLRPGRFFTNDGRFLFYVELDDGFFWRDRLMRYDIANRKVSCVRALKRGLYKE